MESESWPLVDHVYSAVKLHTVRVDVRKQFAIGIEIRARAGLSDSFE